MATHRVLAYRDVGYVPPGRTRVLLALIDRYRRTGRATIRELAEDLGWTAVTTVHLRLYDLRLDGLVTWEDGLNGTPRPTVAFIDLGSPEGVPQ